ncbi:MAG: hypothetical protein ACI4J5_09705 [Oscillospiraceae bacterium]
MKTKEYYKMTFMLLPKFTRIYIIFMSILTPLIMTISAFFGSAGPFSIGTILFPYALLFLKIAVPMQGASPSVKKSLSSAAQARELQGGSTTIYDMLCVMPLTHRQIVSFYMSFLRGYTWFASLICIAALLITEHSWLPFLTILSFSLIFMINTLSTAVYMTKLEKPIDALTMLLYIAMVLIYMLNITDSFSLAVSVPDYAAVLFIIGVNVLHELIMRATHLSPGKFYARNGELNV